VKQARQARRDAIAAVREEATDRITDSNTELRAAQKALYAKYCQDDDLYWASMNDVLDHHKTAVKRIKATRTAGRPAQLRAGRKSGAPRAGVRRFGILDG
jgi:hypothetical protein